VLELLECCHGWSAAGTAGPAAAGGRVLSVLCGVECHSSYTVAARWLSAARGLRGLSHCPMHLLRWSTTRPPYPSVHLKAPSGMENN